MLAGGCASKADLDNANAANRRAQDSLREAHMAIQQLQAENQKLQTELEARDQALKGERDRYALLQDALNKLKGEYDDLLAKYTALSGKKPPEALDAGPLLPAEMDKFLKALAEQYPELFTYYPEKGMLKLNSDLTFEKGSDTVKPGAVKALKKFLEVFDVPEAAKYHVYIAGHTDDIPIVKSKDRHPTNWYLSVHRSVAVQEVLVDNNFAPKRVGAMGFGEFHPVEPNAPNKKGNQANRRVEIWILPPERFLTMPGIGGDDLTPKAEPVEEPATEATEEPKD